MDRNLRKTDILARFGGEEFVVLLPEIDKQHGMKVAEKLRYLPFLRMQRRVRYCWSLPTRRSIAPKRAAGIVSSCIRRTEPPLRVSPRVTGLLPRVHADNYQSGENSRDFLDF